VSVIVVPKDLVGIGIMRIAKIVACAASTLLALGAPAGAADMPEIIQQPAVGLQQLGSSWYLRGDIAYRANGLSDAAWNGVAISDPGVGSAFAMGGGVGLKRGWMRFDVTADYAFPAPLRGNVPGVAVFGGSIDSVVVLANVYADLGTWHAFTPYVGAGLGAATVRTSGVANTFPQPTDGITNGQQWNVAWALMAGIGYNVTPSVLVDLGYRYVHLGDAPSGVDQFGTMLAPHGLSANEVRLGVRYTME
jgi:opacity protein-like surface antigen